MESEEASDRRWKTTLDRIENFWCQNVHNRPNKVTFDRSLLWGYTSKNIEIQVATHIAKKIEVPMKPILPRHFTFCVTMLQTSIDSWGHENTLIFPPHKKHVTFSLEHNCTLSLQGGGERWGPARGQKAVGQNICHKIWETFSPSSRMLWRFPWDTSAVFEPERKRGGGLRVGRRAGRGGPAGPRERDPGPRPRTPPSLRAAEGRSIPGEGVDGRMPGRVVDGKSRPCGPSAMHEPPHHCNAWFIKNQIQHMFIISLIYN